jgi:hypothetical protein
MRMSAIGIMRKHVPVPMESVIAAPAAGNTDARGRSSYCGSCPAGTAPDVRTNSALMVKKSATAASANDQ